MIISHGGDVGDLLAAGPAIRTLLQPGDKAKLVLFPASYVRERFTEAKVERLRPLLERQPFIGEVSYWTGASGINLDLWRQKYNARLNLADMVTAAFNLSPWPREEPWLVCDEPNRVAPVVIHRSGRYWNDKFPWGAVWSKYHKRAVFVGMPEEHADWQRRYGPISYHPTGDWWELCRVVAGASLYIGNQSGPLWLRLGLALPLICEVYPPSPNCHFERTNALWGVDGNVELLPDVT